jgi:HEAT repeat protein
VQSGGFTGLKRSAAMSLGELEPHEVAPAATALRSLDKNTLAGAAPAAPSQPRYELTVRDGADTHTVVLYQTQIPEALQPLVKALQEKM